MAPISLTGSNLKVRHVNPKKSISFGTDPSVYENENWELKCAHEFGTSRKVIEIILRRDGRELVKCPGNVQNVDIITSGGKKACQYLSSNPVVSEISLIVKISANARKTGNYQCQVISHHRNGGSQQSERSNTLTIRNVKVAPKYTKIDAPDPPYEKMSPGIECTTRLGSPVGAAQFVVDNIPIDNKYVTRTGNTVQLIELRLDWHGSDIKCVNEAHPDVDTVSANLQGKTYDTLEIVISGERVLLGSLATYLGIAGGGLVLFCVLCYGMATCMAPRNKVSAKKVLLAARKSNASLGRGKSKMSLKSKGSKGSLFAGPKVKKSRSRL